MILTQGEKMVWAVAFLSEVAASRLRLYDSHTAKLCSLVTAGDEAVEMLREAGECLQGEDYQMLRAMLGDEG